MQKGALVRGLQKQAFANYSIVYICMNIAHKYYLTTTREKYCNFIKNKA